MPTRNIVGIGGSAGSLEALKLLLAALPADVPLIVLIATHRARPSDSLLERALGAVSALPVMQAEDGMVAREGHAYTAPPDRHLLLTEGGVLRVTAGPRENSSRPAIDPLFRSIATHHGARGVGIVLTGYLHDGAAGLAALGRCGGATIVQDPGEATYADMPEAALRAVPGAEVLRLDAMAGRIAALARTEAAAPIDVPADIAAETAIALKGGPSMSLEDTLGSRSNLTCPHCRGALWEMHDDAVLRFRCHTGHAYTADTVYEEHTDRVEEALWSAMRAHRERSEVARRLGERARGLTRQIWDDRARDAETDAELIRSVLVERGTTRGG